MPKWPAPPIGPKLTVSEASVASDKSKSCPNMSVNPGTSSTRVGPGGQEEPVRFLPPPPPPPLAPPSPLAPPPPAHMQLFSSSLVMVKTEPLSSEELSLVNSQNFNELDEANTSSHEEILNSEFGQTVRETVPSGRTVLGKIGVNLIKQD